MKIRNSITQQVWSGAMIGILLFFTILQSGCQSQRLFYTPKSYEKLEDPVVRINVADNADNANYQHKIIPDDRLAIRFMNNIEFANGLQTPSGQGSIFLVDLEGYINLPLVGPVKVGGMTREAVQRKLMELYGESFTNPSIEVQITGLSVSVQGEVLRPGIIELPRERTSLVEVLANSGGITAYGKKDVVKVIRGVSQEKKPEIYIFDLTQLEAIESTDLILRDKDIVYVEPRGIRIFGNLLAPYATFLSLLSTAGSLALVTFGLLRQ